MNKAIIYTTPTCIFCHALMEWLDDNHFPYENRDVTDPAIAAEAEKALGHSIDAVPVSIVDGQEIVGFDRPAFKKIMKAKAA